MRNIKRIPIICDILKNKEFRFIYLDNVLNEKFIGKQLDLFKDKPISKINIEKKSMVLNNLLDNGTFESYWKENCDLRLIQIMISTGLIENLPGIYFYKEGSEHMIELGLIAPKDIMFWGRNYTKDKVRLEETEFILLRDMDSDHIETILLEEHVEKDSEYYDYFVDILKEREAKYNKTST